MKSETTHIVRRQVLDIHTSNKAGTWQLQNRIRDFYNEELLPELERAFNDLDTGNEIIRIDQLSIDLGAIAAADLNRNLVDKFRREIAGQLQKAVAESLVISHSEKQVLERVTVEKSETEKLFRFLKTGILPVGTFSSDLRSFEKLVLEKICSSPEGKTQLIVLLKSTVVLNRFINQFDVLFLYKVAFLLFASPAKRHRETNEADDLAAFARLLVEVLDQPSLSEREMVRTFFKDLAVNPVEGREPFHLFKKVAGYAQRKTGIAQNRMLVVSLKVLLASSAKKTITKQRELVAYYKAEVMQLLSAGGKQPKQFTRKISDVFAGAKNSAELFARLDEDFGKLLPGKGDETQAGEKKAGLKKRTEDLAKVRKKAGKKHGTKKTGITDDEEETNPSFDFTKVADRKQEFPAAQKEIEKYASPDELLVTNAGLVLLWNYLSHYLKHFGLVDETGFTSEAARHRAVHLLQYISTGHTASPEYETGLSKILCGMPLTEVLETDLEISEDEKSEGESLLQVVIKHWGALGNAGNLALRQSFICRPGIMIKKDNTWILRVEQAGVDILLDKLPWSFGIIQLRWMTEPIYVEWT